MTVSIQARLKRRIEGTCRISSRRSRQLQRIVVARRWRWGDCYGVGDLVVVGDVELGWVAFEICTHLFLVIFFIFRSRRHIVPDILFYLFHPHLQCFHWRLIATTFASSPLFLALSTLLLRVEMGSPQMCGCVIVNVIPLSTCALLAISQEFLVDRDVHADPGLAYVSMFAIIVSS